MTAASTVNTIKHTGDKLSRFNIRGHSKDVHKTNFFRSPVTTKPLTTAKGLTMQTKDKMYIFDKGATRQMIGLSSLTEKK